MALQTFACPACGSRKTLADAQAGEKIHCTCGMSYPASPVFAVTDGTADKKASGPGRTLVIAVAALAACGGVAVWMMNRPAGPPPDQGNAPTAIAAKPADLPTETVNEHPTPAPADSSSVLPTPPHQPPDQPPDKPKPANPTPPVKPPLANPVASVAADTLWDAFNLGPAVANRYAGKVVEVKAHGRLARDTIDRPYFGAVIVTPHGRTAPGMSAEQRQWEKDGYPPSVRCYLSPEQAATLEKEGDQDVLLRGICTGRKDRDDVYLGYIVEMDNCVVVAPK